MSDSTEPVRLPGGNVAPVYRVGDTVRRVTGSWTPAVHALLRHLERSGFEGAPRVVGIDDDGREILSYIEGSVPYASDIPSEIWSDEALAQAARLIRAYHEAVQSFEPPPGARWRLCPGAPTQGDIVCHNDIAPWNTAYRDGAPVAFIDWDLAAPATRIWDIAYAAWRFVPLYYDGIPGSDRQADTEEYARRLALFCDEYGPDDRSGLLDAIQDRQQAMYDTVRTWGEAGVPGFAEMWQTGHANAPLRDKAFVRTFRQVLGSKL
ncbi:MAG: aminoglycoside phosphotransferase family protein [Chloroflexota bacterium]|nr:aminoglycoside phosphotransferase family protein [Chloroflexota bacterium]